MANKKGLRSSKTDHVLSLLSGGSREEALKDSKVTKTQADSQVSGMEEGKQEQTAASHAVDHVKMEKHPETQAPSKGKKRTSGSKTKSQKGGRDVPTSKQVQPANQDQSQEEEPLQESSASTVPPRREGERLTTPILQVARTNHEALSDTIRDALSQALEEELTHPEPQPQLPTPPRTMQTEPSQTFEISTEKPEIATPQEKQSHDQKTPQETKENDFTNKPFAPRQMRLPDGAVCVNVMELLVEERMERYVKMFEVCTCPRCMADVRALALARLPAKYVVLPEHSAIPMLSFYRSKFETIVVAEVIQACKTVVETPRHVL